MMCPKCDLELIIVRFRYYYGKCIPDGVERFFCLKCGYQKIKRKDMI